MRREMVMKKYYLIILAIVLFVLTNLIITYKSDRIDQTILVTKPILTQKNTLKDNLPTKGKVLPSDVYEVFYEPDRGYIEEVLVKEGQEISVGTPLVQYEGQTNKGKIEALQQSNERLDLEIEKLNEDISVLQTELDNEITNTPTDQETKDTPPQDNSRIWEYEIKDKEYEIKLLEIEKEKNQKEIDAETSAGDNKTITSKKAGIVVKTNEFARKADDPLITVYNQQPNWVKTYVKEQDIQKVKAGQEVMVETEYIKAKRLEGSVISKGNLPVNQTKKDGQSIYEVTIELNPDVKPILAGLHVKGEITLRELNDVIVLPRDAIIDNKVFVMDKGKLYRQDIKVGMMVDNKVAVTKGLKEKMRLLPKGDPAIKNRTAFIMPANTNAINKNSFDRFTWERKLVLFARGMFQ